MTDTIFALATPPGTGGVAIVRASGPQALAGLRALTHSKTIAPRTACLRVIHRPSSVSRETPQNSPPAGGGQGGSLDRALVLAFPAPGSYTGEDVAEYHLHGGRAVVQSVLDAIAALPGHRPAKPGEFTRRAVLNDKMDLTAAEGLADLIAAQTQAQAAQALAQMDGSLAQLYETWRAQIARALAHAEAALEFPDEDLPSAVPDAVLAAAQEARAAIAAHLADRRGERLRDGLKVAIIGPPNAGKSSLLNALARRDAAIVTDQPGTTRDTIEVPLDLASLPVTLIDTAGLRDTACAIEAEGVARAQRAAEAADIVLALADGTQCVSHEIPLTNENVSRETLHVVNKSDAPGFALPANALPISAKTGAGLEALLQTLTEKAQALAGSREAPALTRTRHRTALEEAASHLAALEAAAQPELAAEELRLAARAIGRITGRVDVEELLDAIFRDFCIGK